MSGTLVMLHGMSGTSEKMMPLANQLVPNDWEVYCPQATISHPNLGGYAWWIKEEDGINYDDYALQAYESLTKLIEELPEGPLIVGGFSQGGAMASMMMERNIQDRILGLVLIGTMSINTSGLEDAMSNIWQRPVVWMHGEKDKIIPISVAEKHIKVFEKGGWKVIKLRHQKGHMVDISQLDKLKTSIQSIASQ